MVRLFRADGSTRFDKILEGGVGTAFSTRFDDLLDDTLPHVPNGRQPERDCSIANGEIHVRFV